MMQMNLLMSWLALLLVLLQPALTKNLRMLLSLQV